MAANNNKSESNFWRNIFRSSALKEGTAEHLLSLVPAFTQLTVRELRQISAIVHRREYQNGEFIFYQGDPGLGMYVIEGGIISIVVIDEKQEQKELTKLGEGDFFGELALLDEGPRSACAIARTPCKLIGFFRPDLFELIRKYPELGLKVVLKLAEMLGERLRATDNELMRLRSELESSRQHQAG
jgi:CRP/FNR family cyclic AMP-dependent transcriptional regulator